MISCFLAIIWANLSASPPAGEKVLALPCSGASENSKALNRTPFIGSKNRETGEKSSWEHLLEQDSSVAEW